MFNDLSKPVHQTQSFQPVQEMLLQEYMHFVIVKNLNLAMLCVVYPVLAGILKCRGESLIDDGRVKFSSWLPWIAQVTQVLSQTTAS